MSLTVNEIENDQGDLRMVSGALMCIRSAVFEDGLDVHLPMYLEDQEISHRCLAKGYGIRIWPDLRSTHIGGLSRRSTTRREQALEVMGLVEAPIQCMSRFQGYRVGWMRPIVFFGGLSRLLMAPVVAGFRVVSRGASLSSEIAWTAEKLRLASWFMLWSFNGRIHTEQVSLAEYFREFETEGVRASPPRRQLK
jgi:GT2 family glycosyltransferase